MKAIRTAAVGLSGMLAMAAMTACGGDDNEGGITFLAAEYSTNTEPYWSELIAEFEEANPDHKVNLQVVDWNEIDRTVTTQISNQDPPDILNLNKFADFAADDLLHPVPDVMSDELLADFVPSFVDNSMLDGTQYGIPFIASARLLVYNAELFSEAGIDEPPATWDDVVDAAEQIDALGDDTIGYGLPLGSEEAQAEFQLWANGNGGHWVDDNGEWTINSAENVETLEFLTEMVDAGLTQPNPAGTNREDIYNIFAQGTVGMLNGHVQLVQRLDEEDTVNYGVAPIPANGDLPSSTLGVQDYLMAFDNGDDNAETIRLFLEFVYDQENYAELLQLEGFLPVTESAGGVLADNESLQPFIQALPEARFYPATDPQWGAVEGDVKQHIGTAVQGEDPQAVLDRIQETAEG